MKQIVEPIFLIFFINYWGSSFSNFLYFLFELYKAMDQNSATVHLLLDKAEDPRYYRKVIEFSENKYNIKSYKISDFDVCRLKHFLSSLNAK